MAQKLIPKKECVNCGVVQPLKNYYNHPRTRDKHHHLCKKCFAEYSRERRKIPKVQEREKKWRRSPAAKLSQKKYAQSEKGRINKQKAREKHRQKQIDRIMDT